MLSLIYLVISNKLLYVTDFQLLVQGCIEVQGLKVKNGNSKYKDNRTFSVQVEIYILKYYF